jgi:hypothetical protein
MLPEPFVDAKGVTLSRLARADINNVAFYVAIGGKADKLSKLENDHFRPLNDIRQCLAKPVSTAIKVLVRADTMHPPD